MTKKKVWHLFCSILAHNLEAGGLHFLTKANLCTSWVTLKWIQMARTKKVKCPKWEPACYFTELPFYMTLCTFLLLLHAFEIPWKLWNVCNVCCKVSNFSSILAKTSIFREKNYVIMLKTKKYLECFWSDYWKNTFINSQFLVSDAKVHFEKSWAMHEDWRMCVTRAKIPFVSIKRLLWIS